MFEVADYTIAARLFCRVLGAIYICAFGPFLLQIRGLIGSQGILPVGRWLHAVQLHYGPRRCWWELPTLFWLNASDWALMVVPALGVVVALLLMCGVWPPVMLVLLYLLYISIVSVGQDFLGFGWEVFLLEITVNAVLLSLTVVPNVMVWVSMNLLLFRFHFQGAAVKLQSRDRTWADLTAVSYHYQTQPIANATAWYVHKLPMWFHKISCLLMFVGELVVPWGIFLGEEVRNGVWVLLVGLQLMIWGTGNFSYLNYMTVALCTILLNNDVLGHLLAAPAISATPLWLDLLLSIAGTYLTAIQLVNLYHHFWPHRWSGQLLQPASRWHVGNRYGIFAIMTTTRFEIVVEGSYDGVTWQEYEFPHKPTDLQRRPHRVSPYQPRIDWQAWFLPFRPYQHEFWFQSLLVHLLRGTPIVLGLFRHNPFHAKPPTYVRALTYVYEFSSWEERKQYGWWWRRKLVGPYSPTLSLKPGV